MKYSITISLLILFFLGSCSGIKTGSMVESKTVNTHITKFSTTANEDSNPVDFYGVNIIKDSKTPVILMVGGSKCIPLFLLTKKNGKVLSSLMFYESLVDSATISISLELKKEILNHLTLFPKAL